MSFLAMVQGGKSGACGARKARITLTPDAKLEAIRRGVTIPTDFTSCVNVNCGKALADLNQMRSLLSLLQ